MWDADRPWIRWPVAIVSGIVAVVAAVPSVIGALWRSVSSLWSGGAAGRRRYTTRQSFARGRGDYVGVDVDEDELLGREDEDEV